MLNICPANQITKLAQVQICTMHVIDERLCYSSIRHIGFTPCCIRVNGLLFSSLIQTVFNIHNMDFCMYMRVTNCANVDRVVVW